ncbi:MAG: FtsX-like permease family protein [Actinomycetota bacterium]
MSAVTTIARKNAIANRSRFALTIAAVALSVAFLTATLILADSITGTAESDIARANDELSFVVQGETLSAGDGGPGEAARAVTASLDPSTLEVVQGIDGVDAVGVSNGFAKLVADGEAVGGGTAEDVGTNWIDDPALNPYELAAGAPPVGDQQVVVDVGLASDGGIVVGDLVEIITPTGLREMTVSGLARFGPADSAPLQRTLLFDAVELPALLDTSGFDAIRAVVDGEAATALSAAGEALPTATVLSAADYVAAEQAAVATPFEFLSIFLLAFAAIATVAGATIIVNTFAIAIAQRRRELALMRAVGATRREVLRAVLGEAAIVAVVATGLGIGAGLLGASALRSLMDIAGLSFLDGPSVVSARTIAIAAAVGLAVTMGSAWAPARRAAAAAPVEALRNAAAEASTPSRWRAGAGFVALALGVGSLVAAASAADAVLLVGAALLVPGLVLAGPSIVSGLVRIVRPGLSRAAGIEGAMAATNLTRNPRRSASTALGLTLGVALVGFFTVLAASLNSSLTTSLDRDLTADAVVTSVSTEVSTIDPGLVERIAAIEGVTAASPLALADASDPMGGEAVVGGVGVDLTDLFDLGVVEGSFDGLAEGGVAVWNGGEVPAPSVGDVVELVFEEGPAELPVVAVFENTLAGFDPPTHLVSATLLDDLQPGLVDDTLFVSVADATAEGSVRAAVAETPGSLFETRADFVSSASSEVDAIRNLVYALLGLTVVIAVVGVANTTALSVSERTRELGMLRAIGATQRGVRRIVRLEAAALSTAGAATGLALAVAGGWALVRAVGGELTTVSVPVLPMAVIVLGAVVAGVLAAAGPGWRASQVPTLDAITGR